MAFYLSTFLPFAILLMLGEHLANDHWSIDKGGPEIAQGR